jgi:hypothetical protein
MADNKTKLAIAKEMSEVLYRYVSTGVITPEESVGILDAVLWATKGTNSAFTEEGKGKFVTEGVKPDPTDWS